MYCCKGSGGAGQMGVPSRKEEMWIRHSGHRGGHCPHSRPFLWPMTSMVRRHSTCMECERPSKPGGGGWTSMCGRVWRASRHAGQTGGSSGGSRGWPVRSMGVCSRAGGGAGLGSVGGEIGGGGAVVAAGRAGSCTSVAAGEGGTGWRGGGGRWWRGGPAVGGGGGAVGGGGGCGCRCGGGAASSRGWAGGGAWPAAGGLRGAVGGGCWGGSMVWKDARTTLNRKCPIPG